MQSDKCKKKEADATAIATTSRGLCGNKTYDYCSTDAGGLSTPSVSKADSSLREGALEKWDVT